MSTMAFCASSRTKGEATEKAAAEHRMAGNNARRSPGKDPAWKAATKTAIAESPAGYFVAAARPQKAPATSRSRPCWDCVARIAHRTARLAQKTLGTSVDARCEKRKCKGATASRAAAARPQAGRTDVVPLER